MTGSNRADGAGVHLDAFSIPAETRAPTGRTNAYLVGGDRALLVDPAGRTDTLDTVVGAREVAHVAVTHTHRDHIGAVADYAAETGATVWARRPDRFERATGLAPDRRLREGVEIPTGDGPVGVLDTPGHAPDHVAFAVAGRVLVGDLAVAEGSVAVAAPEGDLRAYLTSLRRLHARNPDRLYPGHGPRIDDPRATCERLLAHRLTRERRVLEAVREGARDIETVLSAAYDKDLSGVRDLARATVAAHLDKLAHEGRVVFDGESGQVRPAQ